MLFDKSEHFDYNVLLYSAVAISGLWVASTYLMQSVFLQGQGDDVDYIEPTKVKFDGHVKALQVSCGFNHTGAIFEYS